jgi:hypothetical protein
MMIMMMMTAMSLWSSANIGLLLVGNQEATQAGSYKDVYYEKMSRRLCSSQL